MSENVNLRKQLYWNTLVRIPALGISFIISIIIARLLQPKDFGIMGIAMMLIGYFNIFTDFGFSEAVIQKGIRDYPTLNSVFTLNFMISSVLAIAFVFASTYIANFFNTPEASHVIQILSLLFVITSFSIIPTAILRRNMDFKSLSLFDISQSMLMSSLTLILVWKGLGYWALVGGQMISITLIAVLLCIRVKWVPRFRYNHRLMRAIYNFSIWNFLKSQNNYISEQIDKVFIGRYLGPVSLGFYDKSVSIAMVPYNSILININSVMFSSFSLNKEHRAALQAQFKKALTVISLIGFPIYWGLFTIAPYFVHNLLGEKWAPMITPFKIILLGLLIRQFGGILASLNVGLGHYKSHTLRLMLSALFFIIACFLGINFGLSGIAFCFVLYNCFMVLSTMQLAISITGLHWRDVVYSLLPAFRYSLIMLIVINTISYYFWPEYSLPGLVIIPLAGAIVYLFCLIKDNHHSVRELKIKALADLRNAIAR